MQEIVKKKCHHCLQSIKRTCHVDEQTKTSKHEHLMWITRALWPILVLTVNGHAGDGRQKITQVWGPVWVKCLSKVRSFNVSEKSANKHCTGKNNSPKSYNFASEFKELQRFFQEF